MKLSKIKNNPHNPRLIKDDKFKKLCNSIKEFPKMMELRPIIIDDSFMVLGGNMRLRACKELGMKEIPEEWVKKASDLTEEEKKQFIIKDNVGFGEWDWNDLANEWDDKDLDSWGVNTPTMNQEVARISDLNDIEVKKTEITPFKKTHILLSFSPEKLLEVQEIMKKVTKIDGVEYEQSSN